MKKIILKSTITCPNCGFRRLEKMPEDKFVFIYECEHCNTVIRPKAKDCCVFCSYGNVPCPSVQKTQNE